MTQAMVSLVGAKDARTLSLGSGFFVNKRGWVVTNHHVVCGTRDLRIVRDSGEEFEVTGVVAEDPEYDVAVLATAASSTPYVPIGAYDRLRRGSEALTAGLTLGTGRRILPVTVNLVFPDEKGQRWIRFAGSITHGFSGGPLITPNGFVVGIITSKVEGHVDFNFALMGDKVRELLDDASEPAPIEGYVWRTPNYRSLRLGQFQDPKWWFNRGADDGRAGKTDHGAGAFWQAVALQPDFAPGYDMLWRIAQISGDEGLKERVRQAASANLPDDVVEAIVSGRYRIRFD